MTPPTVVAAMTAVGGLLVIAIGCGCWAWPAARVEGEERALGQLLAGSYRPLTRVTHGGAVRLELDGGVDDRVGARTRPAPGQ
jgi:hypothetical protein